MINLLKLIEKAFVRLRTAAMNPFRRVVRRIQQLFNVNLITAKLITPINKKIRQILTFKPRSKEDYVTIGRFWISRKLIYFLILAACASVFIYFTWFAPAVSDMVSTTSLATSTYFDYDDLKLEEFSGKANIRGANGEVVYTGDIDAGVCTGTGTLWNQDGVEVYKGSFDHNLYAGAGILYYPDNKIRYEGNFTANQFSGTGTCYYQNGVMEYTGEFLNGSFSGEGILYDEAGNMQYTGNFENGNFNGTGALYYANGVKEYEGEFYLGKIQGMGTAYSSTGKKLFTGSFVRGEIQYESLLEISMEDVIAMCNETPQLYYAGNQTCFLFEGLGVAVETDCAIGLKREAADTEQGDTWYIENGAGEEELPEVVTATDGNELPAIRTTGRYSTWYYLGTGEWIPEEEIDYSKIMVTGLSVFRDDFSVDFLEDVAYTSSNGAAELLECTAIEQLRAASPTMFSNISFQSTTRMKRYTQITDMNLAEAIYVETYEIDHVRYKLCYEADNYKDLRFICMETY